jgi:NADH-quinone oxidoreductase subunit A
MQYQLLTFLVFTLFGIAFVVVTVSVLGRLLRPKVDDPAEPAKKETYECGEPAIGSSWVRFDIRFYTIALIFLIFDVEVTFLYPWALIFKPLREAKLGLFLFLEVLFFIVILLVGFAYCWAKGDLDWIKSVTKQSSPTTRQGVTKQEPAEEKAPAL